MASDIVKLVVVLALVALFVIWLRRAGDKSRERSARATRDRVSGAPEVERKPRERKRERFRPPGQQADDEEPPRETKAARAARKRREEEADEEEEPAEGPPIDEAEKAAWQAGLAKTRGG